MMKVSLKVQLETVFKDKKFCKANGPTWEKTALPELSKVLGNQMWPILVMNATMNITKRDKVTFNINDTNLCLWFSNFLNNVQQLKDKNGKVMLLKKTEEDKAPWWNDLPKIKELLNKRNPGKSKIEEVHEEQNLAGDKEDAEMEKERRETDKENERRRGEEQENVRAPQYIASMPQILEYVDKFYDGKRDLGETNLIVSREALQGEQLRAKCILRARKALRGDSKAIISFGMRAAMLQNLYDECENEDLKERIAEKITAYKFVLSASHLDDEDLFVSC